MNRRLLLGVLNGLTSGAASGVQISDRTIQDVRTDNTETNASYSLLTNGLAYRSTSTLGPQVIPGQWTSPTAPVGADYEVFAEPVDVWPGTTVTGSALNTWLPLSASQSWAVISPGPGPDENRASLLVSIRRVSDQQVVATALITLEALTYNGQVPL